MMSSDTVMYQRVTGLYLMGLLYYKLGLSCNNPHSIMVCHATNTPIIFSSVWVSFWTQSELSGSFRVLEGVVNWGVYTWKKRKQVKDKNRISPRSKQAKQPVSHLEPSLLDNF